MKTEARTQRVKEPSGNSGEQFDLHLRFKMAKVLEHCVCPRCVAKAVGRDENGQSRTHGRGCAHQIEIRNASALEVLIEESFEVLVILQFHLGRPLERCRRLFLELGCELKINRLVLEELLVMLCLSLGKVEDCLLYTSDAADE